MGRKRRASPAGRSAMDIVQLKTLIHVAELGSLSKAADRLQIAQPALSRQIRLLEKELGTYLFERHGRGMVITEAGRKTARRLLRTSASQDELVSPLMPIIDTDQGQTRRLARVFGL